MNTMAIKNLQQTLPQWGYDGFLVPISDPYQNEFVPPPFRHLSFLTGFQGSAGCALVMHDCVLLFVDSRYTIQARLETSWKDVTVIPIADFSLGNWLKNGYLPNKKEQQPWKLGYDSRLHTAHIIEQYQGMNDAIDMVPCDTNPIEALWNERPEQNFAQLRAHPEQYRGISSYEKRQKIAKILQQHDVDMLLVASPEALAWTMNIRSDDISYTPIALATLFIHRLGHAHLLTHHKKHSKDVMEAMGDDVTLYASSLPHDISLLTKIRHSLGGTKSRLLFDHRHLSHKWASQLKEAGFELVFLDDPITPLKAQKNAAEQDGMRRAHIEDGVALVRFHHWLEHHFSSCDEGKCVQQLEFFRTMGSTYLTPSFATISATGGNGAIVHYNPHGSGEALREGDLYLCDSGGQYPGGTTDVTRTVFLGSGCPSKKQQKDYTLVLKGHIDLARHVFGETTTCADLDHIARAPLAKHNLSYAHGTSHGVGAALAVHEMPPSLSSKNFSKLCEGMTLSNEPGLYRQNEHGIRIESVMLTIYQKGSHMAFETLTMCPLDASLILHEDLSQEQQNWLNNYHQKVSKTLSPYLQGDELEWLKKNTIKDVFKSKPA